MSVDRHVELARLRQWVTRISSIHRPSASPGEEEAAVIIHEHFRREGAHSRLVRSPAHGTYWQPLGALSLTGVLAARVGKRHRLLGTILGTAAAAAVWDDCTGGPQHHRRAFGRKNTTSVIAEFGDPDPSTPTTVFVAHHDAARSGSVFHPGLPTALERVLPTTGANGELLRRSSPPLMWPVLAGPALAAAGSLFGSKALLRMGAVVSAGAGAVMADIMAHRTVPGANDNATGVAVVMALAERLSDTPVPGRVILVSTGAEESFMEGMRGCMDDLAKHCNPDNTLIVCIDTVGSQQLCQLRAEGKMRLYHYPEDEVARVQELAEQTGVSLEGDMVLRNATDGLIALRRGWKAVMIGSYSDHGAPANYHWMSDTDENVLYENVQACVDLCDAIMHDRA